MICRISFEPFVLHCCLRLRCCRIFIELRVQYNEFQNNKVQALIANWTRNTDLFGKTISLNKGNQNITGKAIRLDTLGRLVILNDSGKEVAFNSGEVRIK